MFNKHGMRMLVHCLYFEKNCTVRAVYHICCVIYVCAFVYLCVCLCCSVRLILSERADKNKDKIGELDREGVTRVCVCACCVKLVYKRSRLKQRPNISEDVVACVKWACKCVCACM